MKKPSLTLIASLVAALFAVAPPVEAKQAKKPNFVLIVADDMGFADIGA